MLAIGLIKEGKIPEDNRVALTPAQCKWLKRNFKDINITVQPGAKRAFSDREYEQAGITLKDDLTDCDVLLGIKEVSADMLIPGKTYLFFSHTKKKQPYNRRLMHAMMDKKITLIDYECLEHTDGQRIIGFGFFAGIVGAHNTVMAYGNRTQLFNLERVYKQKDYRELIHTYFGLKLPAVKVAVTGSGRVAHGILEVMNLMDIQEKEPDEYISKEFPYPVYVHLKGSELYRNKSTGKYSREHFHAEPEQYYCLFEDYCSCTDILINGVYWDEKVPRLFSWNTLRPNNFRITTIGDITDDVNGSVPCNLDDGSIADPVYSVNKFTHEKEAPYLKDNVDIMAVGNLPNELPRDASRYFGEQLIKYVLDNLRTGNTDITDKATILKDGKLTKDYLYLSDYTAH